MRLNHQSKASLGDAASVAKPICLAIADIPVWRIQWSACPAIAPKWNSARKAIVMDLHVMRFGHRYRWSSDYAKKPQSDEENLCVHCHGQTPCVLLRVRWVAMMHHTTRADRP
jgi:hypothetical protein